MRPKIKAQIVSPNFPSFAKLQIPPDPTIPTCAVFSFSFSLQNPRLELPMQMAPCCRKDGYAAINVDGPLTQHISTDSVKRSIFAFFESCAIKDKPSSDFTIQGQILDSLLLDP